MTQTLRPYRFQVHVDALPALCARKSCYADPVPGLAYCAKHSALRKPSGPPRTMPVADGISCVYAIRGGDFVKIGRTTMLRKRFSAIVVDSPHKLTLHGAVAAPEWMEEGLHVLLRPHMFNGEWFHWDRPDVQRVCDLIRDQNDAELRRIAIRLVNSTFR